MKKKISFVIITAIMLVLVAVTTGCIQKSTVIIPMEDGVNLATDIHRLNVSILPHGSILIRTPYNKNQFMPLGTGWALTGWPTVIQDMRGRFASEGIDTVFRNAHTDGPDTLEWIGEQCWSNGKIADMGGFSQWNMSVLYGWSKST